LLGLFEEEEEGIGAASNVDEVKGEDLANPGSSQVKKGQGGLVRWQFSIAASHKYIPNDIADFVCLKKLALWGLGKSIGILETHVLLSCAQHQCKRGV